MTDFDYMSFEEAIETITDVNTMTEYIVHAYEENIVDVPYLAAFNLLANTDETIYEDALRLALPEILDVNVRRNRPIEGVIDLSYDLSVDHDEVPGRVNAAVVRNGGYRLIDTVMYNYYNVETHYYDEEDNQMTALMPFFDEAVKYKDDRRLNVVSDISIRLSPYLLAYYLLYGGVNSRIVHALAERSDLKEIQNKLHEWQAEGVVDLEDALIASGRLDRLQHPDV